MEYEYGLSRWFLSDCVIPVLWFSMNGIRWQISQAKGGGVQTHPLHIIIGAMQFRFTYAKFHCQISIQMDASCQDIHDPCWRTYIDEITAHPENYACLLDSTGAPLLTTDESNIHRRSKRCVWMMKDMITYYSSCYYRTKYDVLLFG